VVESAKQWRTGVKVVHVAARDVELGRVLLPAFIQLQTEIQKGINENLLICYASGLSCGPTFIVRPPGCILMMCFNTQPK
jgi:hypothetical protein